MTNKLFVLFPFSLRDQHLPCFPGFHSGLGTFIDLLLKMKYFKQNVLLKMKPVALLYKCISTSMKRLQSVIQVSTVPFFKFLCVLKVNWTSMKVCVLAYLTCGEVNKLIDLNDWFISFSETKKMCASRSLTLNQSASIYIRIMWPQHRHDVKPNHNWCPPQIRFVSHWLCYMSHLVDMRNRTLELMNPGRNEAVKGSFLKTDDNWIVFNYNGQDSVAYHLNALIGWNQCWVSQVTLI